MNKLTADVARMDIGHLREHLANPHAGLSLKEEKYLQALEIALPVLEQQESTTDNYRQIENDCWIEWSGGKCPEPVDAQVEVKMRDGVKVIGNADVFRWNLAGKSEVSSCDIIAYRVIENDGREG